MGGGNAQKSAMARERNKKNAPKEAKSTLKDTQKTGVICKICR
jgi:hypothetical protein